MKAAFFFSLQNVLYKRKPLQYNEEAAFGISYISALLKKNNHFTRLFVLTRETTQSQVSAFLREFNPGLICFTAVASEFPFVCRFAGQIKEQFPKIFLLGGGCHISLNPQDAISKAFDAICIGEGEYPTLELAEQLSRGDAPSGIKNLWIKSEGRIEKNPTRPFIENLDELPFADRQMWTEWVHEASSRHVILLGRGCPFQCTYCSNHALGKLSAGRYVRLRSAENILQELDDVSRLNPLSEEVYFEIETFGINMPWAIGLCAKLEAYNSKRKKPLVFGVNLRVVPNLDMGPLFKSMQKSNFRFVNIGLESGCERIRRDVMKRHYSNEDFLNTVNLARQHGLRVHVLNMLGLPTETEDDFRETILLNRIAQPDMWPSHSVFFPYQGTEIHQLCKEERLMPSGLDTERERSRPVLELPGFPKRKIQHYFVWFDYYVYKGHRPFFKLLARAFVARLHSSYRLMRLYRAATNNRVLRKLKHSLNS